MSGILAALVLGLALAPAASGQAVDPYNDPVVVKTYEKFPMQRGAFSPDGRTLIGDSRGDTEKGDQVYAADFDPETGVPSRLRCLTCGQPGPNGIAKFSPDGRKILFHSKRGNVSNGQDAGSGSPGDNVWIMNADGSQPVALTTGGPNESNFHAVFSPDGRKVAWTYRNYAVESGWNLMIADYVDSPTPRLKNVRAVTSGLEFYEMEDWTTDGRYLIAAYTGACTNLDTYLVDPANGKLVRRLTHDPVIDEQAHPMPDGRTIIQMSGRDNPGGTAVRSSCYGLLGDRGVDTPDSPLIVSDTLVFFGPVSGTQTDLYAIDAIAGDRKIRRLTFVGDQGELVAEFGVSPNGRHITFGGRIPAVGDGQSNAPGKQQDFLGLQIASFLAAGAPGTGSGGGSGSSAPAAAGRQRACAASADPLAGATVVPRGRGLTIAPNVARPVGVDVFQHSRGRRVIGHRLVARFRRRSGAFSWGGAANVAGRGVTDGVYSVRVRVAGSRAHAHRFALRRRGGRFIAAPLFERRGVCGMLSYVKLDRPVFGGRGGRALGIAYRVGERVRVAVTVMRRGRVVRRLGTASAAPGRTYRRRLSPRGLRRGRYEVRVRATAGGRRSIMAVVADRL